MIHSVVQVAKPPTAAAAADSCRLAAAAANDGGSVDYAVQNTAQNSSVYLLSYPPDC